jgi:flagellar protein FliL
MADNPKSEKKPKSLKLFIIIGIGVLLLGAAGGGAWFFFFKGKPSPPPTTAASNGHIYKMEPFLVNLADPGQPRYLKVTLHLESNQEKPSSEYEKRQPQLRDAILTILSSRNYRDIMTSEGKSALREEIKGKVNQLLVNVKAQNIFFTEFVIQ